MATPYSSLHELFFRRIENDRDFFDYIDKSFAECMEIANKRASGYLNEAVSRVIILCHPSISLDSHTETGFTADLTTSEKYLISSLMYEQYLERDIAYIKTLDVNYTPSALKVFDPSNARSTYLALYKMVHDENERLIDTYKNTDRNTGEMKSLDFSLYDSSKE